MDSRLPLGPNLGFYRKGAKELKRALAAGDPAALARLNAQVPRAKGASLKVAQTIVAREHGFATWSAFKAAVEAAAASGQPTPAASLMTAIKGGDAEAVQALLAGAPALASRAALVEACDRGLVAIVRLLLDAGADPREPQALAAAAHPGPHKMQAAMPLVQLLLERGAADDVFTHAMLGKVEELRRDLSDVDVNTRGPSGTALDLAAGNGHVEAVRLLLEAGATVTRALWDRVYLHIWAPQYRAIARMLVDRGVECTFEEAFEIGHVPAVRRLLAGDPTLKDRRQTNGDLPIERVILRGDAELARALLEAGADDPSGQGRALVEAEPQRGRNLARAVFRNCNFDAANFQSCSFEKTVFQDVDLSGVRIHFANLAGVRIDAASISGMTIWGIELEPLLAAERRRRGALGK
jgi:ankyrin repeat protein